MISSITGNSMRVIIVGLGSIGKRHVRILKSIKNTSIFYFPSNKTKIDNEFIKKYNIELIYSLDECIAKNPDFVIISNPTPFHIDFAIFFAENKIPIIIEKPLSYSLKNVNKLKKIVENNSLPFLVGFQFRHHPLYITANEIIKEGRLGEILAFNGYVGQYLPDWRPNQEYSHTTSAIKELGGGVVFDISHEIDIAVSIMGKVHEVVSVIDKISSLKIDTEDIANIILMHENGCQSNISLNYIDRNFKWISKIIGSEGTLVWDYVNGTLELQNGSGTIINWSNPEGFERDDLFRDQFHHWFAVLKGEQPPVVSIDEAIELTKVLIAIKN